MATPIQNQGKIYYSNGQIGYIAKPYDYFTKGMLNGYYFSDSSEKSIDDWIINAANDPDRYKQVVKIELIYNETYPVTHFAEQVFTNMDTNYYLSRVSTYMPNLKEIKIGEGFGNFERGKCFIGLGYVEKIDLPSTFRSVGGVEIGDHFMIDMANLETLILRNPTPPEFYSASGARITPEDSFKRLGHTVVYVPDAAVETYKSNSVFADLDIRPLSEYQESDKKTVFLGKTKGKFELNGNKLGKFYINGVEYKTPNVITGVKKNYIEFKDPEVERICIENFSSDGVGVTYEDAASITNLGGVFSANTAITSFNELQYFTGLQEISRDAFGSCSALTSVTIPDSVTTIGWYAFYNCRALTSITIPENVTTIDYAAFSNCLGLTSVNIPDGLTTIGKYAFNRCLELSSINIPDSLTIIGEAAFRDCSKLKTITIPSGVTTIGDYVFFNCSALTSITIPSGVTTIGDYAFYYCRALTSITSYVTSAPTIMSTTFRDVLSGGKLYVPANATGYDVWMGTGDYYLGKYNWTLQKKYIEFADPEVKRLCVENWGSNGEITYDQAAAVTDLGSVFQGNTAITSFDELQYFIGLPEISDKAFSGCSSLTSITIPDSVTSIGQRVFRVLWGSPKLTSITSLALTAPTITKNTFQGLPRGGTLYVPNGSTGYDVWMQKGYSGLGEFYLGNYNWTLSTL